jgi:hypothetical protein
MQSRRSFYLVVWLWSCIKLTRRTAFRLSSDNSSIPLFISHYSVVTKSIKMFIPYFLAALLLAGLSQAAPTAPTVTELTSTSIGSTTPATKTSSVLLQTSAPPNATIPLIATGGGAIVPTVTPTPGSNQTRTPGKHIFKAVPSPR